MDEDCPRLGWWDSWQFGGDLRSAVEDDWFIYTTIYIFDITGKILSLRSIKHISNSSR